jgi:hypothetical protein
VAEGRDWPGKGPYAPWRWVAAWPRFQFSYTTWVRLTQEYVEVISSGNPASQDVRLTQEYVEVLSSGDPALQNVRLTQEYVEVITSMPPLYSYLGAADGQWPGPGPSKRGRLRPDILNKAGPYPFIRETQQFAEVISTGDPSLQFVQLTQQYAEAITSGDPGIQQVRLTEQFIEIVGQFPDQAGFLGAGLTTRGMEWPGAGPNRRDRFIPDTHTKDTTPQVTISSVGSAAGVGAATGVSATGYAPAAVTFGPIASAPISAGVPSLITSVSPSPVTLTDVTATGAVGSFSVEIDIPLIGVAGTGVAAPIGLEEDIFVNLTAVSATGTVGSFTVEEDIPLTGVFGTGAASELGPGILRATQINQQTLYEDSVHEILASQLTKQTLYQEADGFTPVITDLRVSQITQQNLYQEADGVHPVVTYVRATQITLQVLRTQGNAPTRNFGQIV